MRILWAKTDLLHPTTRGGQIRTLEMLRRIHQRHEVHYVCCCDGPPDALERAKEYCSYLYPVPHHIPEKTSPAFFGQLVTGLFDPRPVSIRRYASRKMLRVIGELTARCGFDTIVCDFLAAAPNLPDLGRCVLFQHNVESAIWKRRLENAADPLRRWYLRRQAERMFRYEKEVCRAVRKVVAVSEADAETMRRLYGVERVCAVSTGVDVDYFTPAGSPEKTTDLVFVGSMDWAPNVDGVLWFSKEVLPLIRRWRPECSFAVVGRNPPSGITALARNDPRLVVTGTVPDVRPWLFASRIAIVPLRVGGGTRLKIFEAMAAGVPVVSTSIGAEGLPVADGDNIRLADAPAVFAECCRALLEQPSEPARIARSARQLVVSRCSWDAVTQDFERLLGLGF